MQTRAGLDHGDILVMDGQCQDEFYHCTDPGSHQERINVTFRWIKQHVASCSFLRTGCGMLFANVYAVFVCSWYGDGGEWLNLAFLVSSQCLVHMGVPIPGYGFGA